MNKSVIILSASIAVLLVAASAFYWYEWRPSHIKKECSKEAEVEARDLLKHKFELAPDYSADKDYFYKVQQHGLFLNDDYENRYKRCLGEKGL